MKTTPDAEIAGSGDDRPGALGAGGSASALVAHFLTSDVPRAAVGGMFYLAILGLAYWALTGFRWAGFDRAVGLAVRCLALGALAGCWLVASGWSWVRRLDIGALPPVPGLAPWFWLGTCAGFMAGSAALERGYLGDVGVLAAGLVGGSLGAATRTIRWFGRLGAGDCFALGDDSASPHGRSLAAIPYFSQAIRLDPRYAPAYLRRAAALHQAFQYDQALADLDEAIRLEPRFVEAYDLRAEVHLNRFDGERTVADFTEAIRLNRTDAAAYRRRALGHHRTGGHGLAEADLAEAIRLDPEVAEHHAALADLLAKLGQHERALAGFSEATRLAPSVGRYFAGRGEAHQALGQLDRPAADFTEAIRLEPTFQPDYERRAEVYRAQGLLAKAEVDLAEVRRLHEGFRRCRG